MIRADQVHDAWAEVVSKEARIRYVIDAATGVPGVTFFWIGKPVPRAPLIYSAGIVIHRAPGRELIISGAGRQATLANP